MLSYSMGGVRPDDLGFPRKVRNNKNVINKQTNDIITTILFSNDKCRVLNFL